MKQFALWLSTTLPSVFLQEHNGWAIPTIQTIHIVGIAIVMGSVLMIALRILGWAGTDQTLRQTTIRFGPWLVGSLGLLAVTGALMVVGDPVRELVTFSFWMKMILVGAGTLSASLFQWTLRTGERRWENTHVHNPYIKSLAILTLLLWVGIVVLGRLIAYDHVWGSWSPAERQ